MHMYITYSGIKFYLASVEKKRPGRNILINVKYREQKFRCELKVEKKWRKGDLI